MPWHDHCAAVLGYLSRIAKKMSEMAIDRLETADILNYYDQHAGDNLSFVIRKHYPPYPRLRVAAK